MSVFFFDIDGTLIDARQGVCAIPPTAVDQLSRLHDLGHKLVICSGRPYAMFLDDLRLPFFDAYVMCNGAHVMVEGKTIFANRLSPELAYYYADLLEDVGCEYMIETTRHIYLSKSYTGIRSFFKTVIDDNIFTFDFDRDEVLQRAIKLEADVKGNMRERLLAEVQRAGVGCNVNVDDDGGFNCFELFSPTISKAVGIQTVLQHFNVPVRDSYGFGDGVNDLEMIRLVGTGVAMGNACDELKAEADEVCSSVIEDGLATYLARIDADASKSG